MSNKRSVVAHSETRVTHFLFTGCMKAGKTKRLITMYKNDSRHKMALKPIIDVRWGRNRIIRSRDAGYVIDDAHVVDDFASFTLCVPDYIAVVYIDEAQFCTNLYSFVCDMTRRNIQVILSGLNETYTQSPWTNIQSLSKIPGAKLKTITLYATCDDCHVDGIAKHTKKMVQDKKTFEKDLVVDPGDHYQAACGACWSLP